MSDKSHVGMSNCYVCGEPSSILLDTRLRDTLERNMGPLGPDDLCHACAEKAKTMACIVAITEKARNEDQDRMRELGIANDRSPYNKRRVFPCPRRADNLLPWVRLAVLDRVMDGKAAKWLVGPVMFAEVQARNQLLTNLTGTPIDEILAAADKAGPGVDTDATTLLKVADQPGGA